ncbi:MAG TPA: Crp/Fnr family transcriptional regulator [Bacteroidales bacterium]|nr:Crp/Fnr family transcriptional regulator [Bacteroidales bacterium]HPB26171.1 Crp/Fnr family transcriptional regulator [Bacteroidales bacterium]HPI31045.1 Crp/Fnr family transcriptional regulator [Bacteroidales bacterium]HQN16920.1 Crp/Fnr family transcriptional regulator [Bacteroidales bacterium]HQP15974.1 Crp/Fnr family transcriptional regulator [Bacteroidales bacterium]
MKIPEYFKNIASLSAESERAIISAFKREELPKGHFLFQQEVICRHIYFIEQGLARTYAISDSGREVTNWFFPENSFLTAINSFYNSSPARDFCILTEDSVVYSMTYSEFKRIVDDQPELAKFCFAVLFELAKQMTEYINSSKFQTAEDRYLELVKMHPAILQRASLGHIASFLGITQETLSRIRAKK